MRSGQRGAGEEPAGLGGWLIILLLFQLISLLSAMAKIADGLGIHTGASRISPDYTRFVLSLALLGLLAATAVALLGKLPIFPRLWKTQAALLASLAALGAVVDALFLTGDPVERIVAVESMATAVLLVMSRRYVTLSRRVKNTFCDARTALPPSVVQQERFLRGFSIGFLACALALASSLAEEITSFVAGVLECSLIGVLVGGGAVLWNKRR